MWPEGPLGVVQSRLSTVLAACQAAGFADSSFPGHRPSAEVLGYDLLGFQAGLHKGLNLRLGPPLDSKPNPVQQSKEERC